MSSEIRDVYLQENLLQWLDVEFGQFYLRHLALWPFTRIYLALSRSSEAVRATLISSGILGQDAYVVLSGPANTYSHYVTTREEYSVQLYEGASTLFGPCKCLCLQHSGKVGFCLARCFPETVAPSFG